MCEFIRATSAQIKEKTALALDRITSVHLRPIGNSPGNVFLISTAYPGVWMEHAFDALCWAQIMGTEEAKKVTEAQMLLFIINRQEDGHLPYKVIDLSIAGPQWQKDTPNGYGQIQECVSFGRLCYETWLLTGNKEFLKEAYAALKGWDEWLVNNRMTLGRGLIETFCVYDTGHDNSARFADIPNGCPDRQGKTYADRPALPIVSPDMNAVFFGDRMALSDMAGALGLEAEKQAWIKKAAEVRDAMFCQLYDKDDDFFYDIDHAGQMRRINVKREYRRLLRTGAVSLEHMPQLYHGVVRRSILDQVYAACGTYFPGPSPDMAISVALSQFVKKHVRFNVPLISSGASPKSSAGLGARHMHKGELKSVSFLPKDIEEKWDERIPRVWTGPTIYAQSTFEALKASGREKDIGRFNFSYFLAFFDTFCEDYRELSKAYRKENKVNGLLYGWYRICVFTLRGFKFVSNKLLLTIQLGGMLVDGVPNTLLAQRRIDEEIEKVPLPLRG